MHSEAHFSMQQQQQQQQHRRGRSLSSALASERDEDLTLFQEMQKRERERRGSIPEEGQMQTPRSTHKSLGQSLHRLPSSTTPIKSNGADDIFSSDWDKNDYDWLMTPPGTPLLPIADRDSLSNGFSLTGQSSVRSVLKTSKLGNSKSEPPSRAEPSSRIVRGNLGLQQPVNASSGVSTSSTMASRRSYSSSLSCSSTPGLNSAVRPSTPSSTYMSRPLPPGANPLARPPAANACTGAPRLAMSSASVHSSTSSGRASIPFSRSASSSRPSTPVKRSPSPSNHSSLPATLGRCSSVNKASSMSKNAILSRASSPTSKALLPAAMHGFSQEQPPNLRTSMPEGSLSNSRGSSARTALQAGPPDAGTQSRRQSSSPVMTRGRTFSDLQNGDKAIFRNGKVDDGAAGLAAPNGISSKMREKTMRMRKPIPSSQEEKGSVVDSQVKRPMRPTPLRDVKSTITSARESSGLGRNLSKKSLDMALRNMDIQKNNACGFHTFMSNVSASTLLRIRSCNNGTLSTSSVTDSPMATSSNGSSEHSMSIIIDPEGSELGDESVSEKGSRSSPASQHDLFSVSKERSISSWLDSPDYRDNDVDIMQIFQQEGLESLSGPESPLVSELDGTIECDYFCLDPI